MRTTGGTLRALGILLLAGAAAAWLISRGPAASPRAQAPATPARAPSPLAPTSAAPSGRETETRLAALVAPRTSSPSPKTNVIDDYSNGQPQGFEGTGVQARHQVPRSPLESAPGYYPPDDPESLAAVTGRRAAAAALDVEFQGGAASLEDLARSLLAGIETKDERALHALRLARLEYETILWPEFPQSRPVTHIPFDEVWAFTTTQSLAGAGRAIGAYGGRPLTLLRVEARPMSYRNFTLYRDVKIVVRDSRDERVVALGFAPSVAERRGRFKALIFKD